MSRAWFRIALADGADLHLVVAPGEHLGDAIAAAESRLRGARPVAAEQAGADEVPLGESVGKGVVVERDAPAALPVFAWPRGILPTLAGARQLGAVHEGWVRRTQGATTALEVLLGVDRLRETYLELVERLPGADNIEVRVTGHHDGGGTTEVWLTPRIGDVRKVIRFLDDHDVELLDNGHVEVSVYVRARKSTLRLTEHKTILWITEDAELADDVSRWLGEHDITPRDELARIGDVDHYHWRPRASRDRRKLLEHLHKARLRRVDSWKD